MILEYGCLVELATNPEGEHGLDVVAVDGEHAVVVGMADALAGELGDVDAAVIAEAALAGDDTVETLVNVDFPAGLDFHGHIKPLGLRTGCSPLSQNSKASRVNVSDFTQPSSFMT